MLGVNIVCPGNLKEAYLRDAVAEYAKRLGRFCRLTITEIAESTPEKEKDAILKACKGYVIALCVEGQMISSEQLAQKIDKLSLSYPNITFVIGSSEGLDDEVKNRADYKMSFSPMTFPHQLMRVILLEQVYRAFTILNHITYHK